MWIFAIILGFAFIGATVVGVSIVNPPGHTHVFFESAEDSHPHPPRQVRDN